MLMASEMWIERFASEPNLCQSCGRRTNGRRKPGRKPGKMCSACHNANQQAHSIHTSHRAQAPWLDGLPSMTLEQCMISAEADNDPACESLMELWTSVSAYQVRQAAQSYEAKYPGRINRCVA